MKFATLPTQLSVTRTVAALAIAGLTALGTPCVAAPATDSPRAGHAMRTVARTPIETRITSLHTRLQITAAQESLWQPVAQIMRDNANTIQALMRARNDSASQMSATDDLRSYGQVADAHAEGIRRLTPAFQALYDSMSDIQKRNADLIFRNEGHHMGRKSRAHRSQQ